MDAAASRAARLLERVFAPLDAPLSFRLWDGTVARVGHPGECRITFAVRSRQALRRLLRRPTALRFGEAYVDGEVDIEGDLFEAVEIGNRIEHLQVPLRTRLAVLASWLRL